MTPRLSLCLLVALATPACAPSLDHLVASRRYADAVCQVRSQAEAERVAGAIERDAGQRVHAYPVHERELVASLGEERGRALARRVTFVLLVTAANRLAIPADRLYPSDDRGSGRPPEVDFPRDSAARARVEGPREASVMLLNEGRQPASRELAHVFGLTGEPMPADSIHSEVKNPERELLLGAVTLGLKQLLFGVDRTTTTTPATREALVRQGPAAMALVDGINRRGGTAFAVLASEASTARLHASLEVSTLDEDLERCSLDLHYRSPLAAAGQPLEAAIDARFGAGPRPVIEPGVERSFTLSNRAGRWSSGGPGER